ncbi:head-tail connector protein [Sphingomonas bisphenolicum]|uniref:Phage gp6-like head-tail connector protein n=1 Tax=Sphingomonas bisphenolicum TaxID=296544 RepID=A0ABN5WD37_9SPHN|nr:hypothetical protein [Sphingomonas bisphenolicum]BBF70194.1 hypothetical protein SBA_ch1_23940 [Sphingomonas bisphenolicum]
MLSAPTVIIAPTAKLVTLPEACAYLRLEEGSLDTEIEGYIASAISDIERMTSTRLAPQTVDILADRFSDLAHLAIGPVQSVTSIRYQNQDGDSFDLDETIFELFGAHLDRGIRLRAGATWPAVRSVTAVITIRLVVGYPILPAHLKRALLDAIRQQFDGSPVDLFTATINDRIWL